MIDQINISLEWINSISRANNNADKILVEKGIRALLLLEELVHINWLSIASLMDSSSHLKD